jgi:hypothetical protein
MNEGDYSKGEGSFSQARSLGGLIFRCKITTGKRAGTIKTKNPTKNPTPWRPTDEQSRSEAAILQPPPIIL